MRLAVWRQPSLNRDPYVPKKWRCNMRQHHSSSLGTVLICAVCAAAVRGRRVLQAMATPLPHTRRCCPDSPLPLAPPKLHRHDQCTSVHASRNPRHSSQREHLPRRMIFIRRSQVSSTSSQLSAIMLLFTAGGISVPRGSLRPFPARGTPRHCLTPPSLLRYVTPMCGVS